MTPPDQWRRTFVGGPYAGHSVRLGRIPGFSDEQTLRIGRGEGWANVALPDPCVSARHCTLRIQNHQAQIRDGAGSGQPSANGTFVQDKRISGDAWTPLPLDQIVVIGGTRFILTA